MRVQSGEFSFYTVAVTAEELWREVGGLLKREREARHWSVAQAAKRAGVDGKTVSAIETGDIGNLAKLHLYAEAFGMTIVDVLIRVLDQTKVPLSPEARRLLGKYERISVPARQALLAGAEAYPDVSEESPASLRLLSEPPESNPRKR